MVTTRRVALSLFLAACLLPRSASAGDVVSQAVWFQVVNPSSPLSVQTVRGTMYAPSWEPGCSRSVVLMLHGVSYGAFAWDFPLQQTTYSVAQVLAARGFPTVVVDQLGYGASDHPNGYTLTVESYGDIAGQMIQQLRAGTYGASSSRAFQQVALFGHSAGTETAELAAGWHGPVDALIASGYTHFPSSGLFFQVVSSDVPRALLSDYIYFGETAENRTQLMYNVTDADPEIVAEDARLATLTPSGQILTIGNQPSLTAVPLITAPVLLLLGERDVGFPSQADLVSNVDRELALFALSTDKSAYVVPEAGHTFMLHRGSPQTNHMIADWLQARIQRCAEP